MPTPSTARMHDFEVVSNQEIADGIFSLVISAPKLASALKPCLLYTSDAADE